MGNKKQPEVRFRGFEEDWKQRKVGEFLKESRIKGSDGSIAKKLTVKLWRKGIIPKEEAYRGSTATQYYVRKSGQFMYGKLDFLNQAFGIVPKELDGFESTLDSPAFDISNGMDSKFFLEFVSLDKFYKYQGNIANGSRKAKRIHPETFYEMTIPLPSFAEQKKIGVLLEEIDESISLHQKELTTLKQTKQGFLQKMFPKEGEKVPEVRLPGFTDDWEHRKAKELCSISTGKGNTQDKVEGGEYPFYVRSATIERSDHYLYDQEAVLTVGDGVGTGKVFHYVNGKYNLHQRVYRMFDFNHGVSAKYFYHYFSKNFYRRVMAMTAKTSVDSVRLEMIADMDITFPSEAEQAKIVVVLDNLDNLITLHQRELELLQLTKKAFLQKLFV